MKTRAGALRALIPASLTARGAILVALACGSVLVPCIIGHRVLAKAASDNAEYGNEAFLAVALAAYLEGTSNVTSEHDQWLEQVSQRAARVRWAGVFDQQGGGMEFRRRTALSFEQISEQIDPENAEPQCRPLMIDGVRSQRFVLLTIPRPEDETTLAAVLDRGDYTGQRAGASLVWLACLGVAGLGLSWAWFVLALDLPIRRFAHSLVTVQDGLAEAVLDDDAPRELADLARSVQDLRQDVKRWRVEATHLRHSVNVTVDARTRKAALAQRRAEHQADTDPLTRLDNRRALERNLPGLFEQQLQGGGDISLVMLDVDHFKQLNDTRGHRAGDDVLAFVGELIRATIRKGADRGVRYGGDEFVLVLPGVTTSEACKVAQRLTALFAQRTRTVEKLDQPLGLSAGVASLREHHAGSWGQLLQMADEAMYWAKRHGSGIATPQDVRSAE